MTERKPRRRSHRKGALVGVQSALPIPLACVLLLFALPARAVSPVLAPDVNRFPAQFEVEAYSGEAARLTVELKVFFPTDEERYVPVRAGLAAILSLPPVVLGSPNTRTQIVSSTCSPQSLYVLVGGGQVATVEGGIIRTKLAFTPSPHHADGVETILLRYPAIELVFERLRGAATVPKAEVRVQLRIWASRESRRIAQEQAAEQARQQREAAEREAQRRQEETLRAQQQARAEQRARWLARLRSAAPLGLVLVAFMALVYRQRPWFRPDLAVKVRPGAHQQCRVALAARGLRSPAEPGRIMSTVWARDRLGRRQRIKVETLATEESDSSAFRPPWASGGGLPSGASRLDVLVSAGRSVPAGRYLARLPAGSVRVEVQP